MNEEARRREAQALHDRVAKEWADKGQLIEGGWEVLKRFSLQDCGPVQLDEMRKAFFLGAQHCYASVIGMLEDGQDPSEKEMDRMMLLHQELDAFRRSLLRKPTP